jgi:hypothetical protein
MTASLSESRMLNRSAIILRAKQPFLEWLWQLPDPVETDMTLEKVNREPQIYLLPQYGMVDEQQELLRDCYEHLFTSQLEGWWTDEADWPSKRDFEMFNAWFEAQFHSVIQDLVGYPLLDDDD